MKKITFEEINKQLKGIFGEEDNTCCIECIKCHGCEDCDFNMNCYVAGFDWMLVDPDYDVVKDGIIIQE